MGAIAIATALLPACVNTKYKTNAPVQSFVVADEPRAAGIGRDIIAQGGRAGDAAAAMAVAMTATLPSRVGLAGGGVCVVFNAGKKEARTLDFLPRAAGPAGVATPGFLRGIYALQAAAGVLRWEQAVVPAEQIARANPGVSRALAQDLAANGARLAADPEAKRIFLPAGTPLAEGTPFAQPDLANTLSQVRRSGVASLYGGPLGAALAQGTTGGGLDPVALRAYQPRWSGTAAIPLGIVSMHFAQLPEPEAGSALTAAWKAAADAPAGERAARAAQALGATGSGPSAPGAGLVVIDPDENGVACTFTMGAPFGGARVVPGTGLFTARGVDRAGFGAPALLANSIVGRTLFAGAGTATGNDGPAAGPAALLTAALPAALDKQPGDAIQARRTAGSPGRATFVACQVSPENGLKDCQPAPDPKAHGLGIQVETERERE